MTEGIRRYFQELEAAKGSISTEDLLKAYRKELRDLSRQESRAGSEQEREELQRLKGRLQEGIELLERMSRNGNRAETPEKGSIITGGRNE